MPPETSVGDRLAHDLLLVDAAEPESDAETGAQKPGGLMEVPTWEEITERRLAMEIRDMVRISMMEDE